MRAGVRDPYRRGSGATAGQEVRHLDAINGETDGVG
jgi:hypothetical protein